LVQPLQLEADLIFQQGAMYQLKLELNEIHEANNIKKNNNMEKPNPMDDTGGLPTKTSIQTVVPLISEHLNKLEAFSSISGDEASAKEGDTHLLILVMGMTGVGKSTFIKLLTGADVEVGHILQPCR
jgi:polynucleotide 5'-kinase involved in rRNA processing